MATVDRNILKISKTTSQKLGVGLRTEPKETVVHGDLVLDRDTTFKGSLVVEGNIRGKKGNKYNLIVNGNIKAWAIKAENIDACNIKVSKNIDAQNIHARGNIEADLILCESLAQDKDATLACKTLIINRNQKQQPRLLFTATKYWL